jgi:hypothetical protein
LGQRQAGARQALEKTRLELVEGAFDVAARGVGVAGEYRFELVGGGVVAHAGSARVRAAAVTGMPRAAK